MKRTLAAACLFASSLAAGDATTPEKPAPGSGKQVVIARLVDGERPIIACGVIAFIGVYVYEVESVESGPPRTGRIVVDVLCPDFYRSHKPPIGFKLGARHRIELGPAKRTYAMATPPPSPDPKLPRFEGKNISLP